MLNETQIRLSKIKKNSENWEMFNQIFHHKKCCVIILSFHMKLFEKLW